jgi:citrate synthase
VSTVTDGVVRYRGRDVLGLVAAREPFEAVAELLWAGPPAARAEPAPGAAWQLSAGQAAPVRVMLGALGGGVPVAQRFAAVVAATAGNSAPGAGRAPDWQAWGRFLVAALIEASGSGPSGPKAPGTKATGGAVGGSAVADGAVARRLWQQWSPLRPTAARVRALDIALVLLAEHELAASTLAVRVAASARAAPAGCVLAGLGTLSGTLHGDAPRLVRELLLRPEGEGKGAGLSPGVGFGHSVHRHGDPRTAPLLQAVRAIATPADRDLIERAGRGGPAAPNVDFALAALTHVARMPPEAATAIFAVARTAGWIAHAAEEYTEPYVRFRGRAVAPARRPH